LEAVPSAVALRAPAVAAAIRILDFLATQSPRAGVTELSRSLGINKSTCFNILATLAHFGVVSRLPGMPRYQLGPKLAELGAAVRKNFWHRDLLRAHFERLVAETQLLCVIGQMLGNEESFVIIDQIAPAGHKAKIPAHPVGTVLPLTGAAMGRALLSCLDEEDAIVIARSSSTVVKPGHDKAWRAKLREIRLRGYDTSVEEFQRGVNAVAVAIQRAGEAYLAVALIGYVRDFPARRIDEVGRRLAADAAQFQNRMALEYADA
jgi:DNA-binding IclR family transcriptional regulator